MLKDNSLIAVQRGYRRLSGNELPQPSQRKAAKKTFSTIQQLMFYKQVNNPQAGKIGIYIEPSDIFEEDGVNTLLDQIESIATENMPKPDVFWGQRSPVFKLAKSVRIPMGEKLGSRHIDAVQFKGFLYRPYYSEEITFPEMKGYFGFGNPVMEEKPMPDGSIKLERSENRPYAAMVLERAVNEFIIRMLLGGMLGNVVPSLGICEFESLSFFDPSGDRKRVGFTINLVEGINAVRTYDYLKLLLEKEPDAGRRSDTIAEIFRFFGTVLNYIHSIGITHGFPHPDNFSFIPDDPSHKIMVNDFDMASFAADDGARIFVNKVLLDLYRAIYTIGRASALRRYFGPLDANAETVIGTSIEQISAMRKMDKDTRETFNALAIEKADPVVNFFDAYFSGQTLSVTERMILVLDRTLDWELQFCFGTADYKERLEKLKSEWGSESEGEIFRRKRETLYRLAPFLLERHLLKTDNPFLEAPQNFLTAQVVEQLATQGMIPEDEIAVLIDSAKKSWDEFKHEK